MNNLPSGTVTFLFTEIEGSTKLAQETLTNSMMIPSKRWSCDLSANLVMLNPCPPFDFLPTEKEEIMT